MLGLWRSCVALSAEGLFGKLLRALMQGFLMLFEFC